MNKRPSIDLMAPTSGDAAPMPEAVQRAAKPVSPEMKLPKSITRVADVRTENLEALAFKGKRPAKLSITHKSRWPARGP